MKFISLVGSEKSGHPIANSVVPHFAGNEMISPKQVRAKLDLFLFKWFSKKGLMNCWTLLPRQIGFITWLFCQQSKKEGNEIPIKYKVYLAWRNQMQDWNFTQNSFNYLENISDWSSPEDCLKITQNVAFEFFKFQPIFVLLKLTCLVTLFDCKLQVFKNSPKWTIFWHF